MKELMILALTIFSVLSGFGQSAGDFKNKYGSGVYYEIRPKILMSAEFDKDGQVCRVLFQPNHMSKKANTIYLGQDLLDLIELGEAFDEIVPKDQRIGEIKSNGYTVSGNMFFGSFGYENISVELQGMWFWSSENKVDFCKLYKDKTPFCSGPHAPEVVTISWTKRSCTN